MSASLSPQYDDQITEIVDRLRRRYPADQVARADLENRVRASYHQFDTACIRSFVGILVERLVRRSLEQSTVSAAGAR